MAKKPSHATRVKRLMYRIPAERKEEAAQLAEDIVFMQDKLEHAKQLVGTTGVAIHYNNGGGQSGIRENPALLAYQKLRNTCNSAIKALDDMRDPNAGSAFDMLDW